MALVAEMEVNGFTHPEAYLKIQKIIVTSTDLESFKDDEKGHSVLVYTPQILYTAQVFVFGDDIARKNNVRAIHSFGIEFDYKGGDIWAEAYTALANLERFKDVNCKNN